MDGKTEGWREGRTKGRRGEQEDRETEGTAVAGGEEERMEGETEGGTDGGEEGRAVGRMDRDGRRDGQRERGSERRTEGQKPLTVVRYHSPTFPKKRTWGFLRLKWYQGHSNTPVTKYVGLFRSFRGSIWSKPPRKGPIGGHTLTQKFL